MNNILPLLRVYVSGKNNVGTKLQPSPPSERFDSCELLISISDVSNIVKKLNRLYDTLCELKRLSASTMPTGIGWTWKCLSVLFKLDQPDNKNTTYHIDYCNIRFRWFGWSCYATRESHKTVDQLDYTQIISNDVIVSEAALSSGAQRYHIIIATGCRLLRFTIFFIYRGAAFLFD